MQYNGNVMYTQILKGTNFIKLSRSTKSQIKPAFDRALDWTYGWGDFGTLD